METISRSKLSTISMVGGTENQYNIVCIDTDEGWKKWQWVGIGWIDIGEATQQDKEKYPVVVN